MGDFVDGEGPAGWVVVGDDEVDLFGGEVWSGGGGGVVVVVGGTVVSTTRSTAGLVVGVSVTMTSRRGVLSMVVSGGAIDSGGGEQHKGSEGEASHLNISS